MNENEFVTLYLQADEKIRNQVAKILEVPRPHLEPAESPLCIDGIISAPSQSPADL